ncbi:GNAT family N-acetyltransferase [Chloroflexota bacterium]
MLIIRPETPEDMAAVHTVNQQAFGQPNEAGMVDKLRNRGALTVSLVATQDDEIIGHIAFSIVKVEAENSHFEAITLAPVAVLPAYQRQGIGSQLVRAGLEECRKLGHEIVVLAGHPEHYPRFGFVPARPKGVDCEVEVPEEAWMVLELSEGALAGRRGRVKFPPEFHEAM